MTINPMAALIETAAPMLWLALAIGAAIGVEAWAKKPRKTYWNRLRVSRDDLFSN
jgi:hypothetical protein